MVIVLGVYVFAAYSFVSRNASEALNQQLRQDFVWVYASLYQTPDGDFMLNEPDLIDPTAMLPWVQVWRGDRSRVLFHNSEAQRRPLPEARLDCGRRYYNARLGRRGNADPDRTRRFSNRARRVRRHPRRHSDRAAGGADAGADARPGRAVALGVPLAVLVAALAATYRRGARWRRSSE